jgi:TRAP transporter TAXI family solute receptor
MSDSPSHVRDPGSAVPWPALVAAVVALVAIVGGFLFWRELEEDEAPSVVIATGSESGTYHAVGMALAQLLEETGVVYRAEERTTEGSQENMRLLQEGAVQLAIVQSDTEPAAEATLLAPLYPEVLHVLLARERADDVAEIADLEGRTAWIGAPASGTRQSVERILEHFDLSVRETAASDQDAAVEQLLAGEIDVLFLLTALPSPLVDRLSDTDRVRFLSFGDPQTEGNEADALALIFPRLHATIIPRSTYGRLPRSPVATVGVTAQLVGRRGLDDEVIRAITSTLFTRRTELDLADQELNVGDRLREDYEPGSTILPYHPGAAAYYERFQPPFLVEYAEAISLGLTLLVGIWSGSLALRQWLRRSRKNRIDSYYLQVVESAPDMVKADRATLIARRNDLLQTRERAFTDLVRERLDADESFSIFQEYVADEIASIERWLATLES